MIDSAPGILLCLSSILTRAGIACDLQQLKPFIGNPLRDTISTLFAGPGAVSAVEVARAVKAYRRLYAREGLYECTVYPRVPEMLEEIVRRGLRAYVVTGKPVIYARRLMKYLQLARYLEGVYGSYLDGRLERKTLLLQHVLSTERLQRPVIVMIGDRRFDMEAARDNGIAGIGASWGYGSVAELQAAGATRICSSPSALLEALLE